MASRKRFSALALAALLLLSAFAAPAEAAETRLRFRRGRSGIVVNGRGGAEYVFRAGTGQRLVVSLTARGDTVFALTSPGGTNMAGEGGTGRAEFELEETGDYHLSVINRDGRRRPFRLSVRIR